LFAYLPGLEGGQAIAEIIFGEVNPSGKLPISYHNGSGIGPMRYYHGVNEKASEVFQANDVKMYL